MTESSNDLSYLRGNFGISHRADPSARIGVLELNSKKINTPGYFPIVRRSQNPNEVSQILETADRLDDGENPPFENIGGFVFEIGRVQSLLESELDNYDGMAQSTFGETIGYSNFYSAVDHLDKAILLDPNTDRMFYSEFRDRHVDHPANPSSVQTIIQKVEKSQSEEDDSAEGGSGESDITSLSEAFQALRERVSQTSLCEKHLRFQRQYNADIFIAPYLPIAEWNVENAEVGDIWNEEERERLEVDEPYNIQLYKTSQELSEVFFDRPVAPVIPLRGAILKRYTKDDDGVGELPQLWKDIVDEYRTLDPPVLFLKSTNATFDPKKPDLEENEAIVEFFKLLRRWADDIPIIFLGVGELCYILMAEGLDGYADPIHARPYPQPPAIGDSDSQRDASDIDLSREYLEYRKWTRTKFTNLDNLGCPGPFCKPFENRDPSSLELSDQDSLRFKHWLWLRNDEIRMLREAIEDNQVVISLRDICEDSKWHKNLAAFL